MVGYQCATSRIGRAAGDARRRQGRRTRAFGPNCGSAGAAATTVQRERSDGRWHPGCAVVNQGEGGGRLLAPLLPAGEPVERLLRGAQFFLPGTPSPDHLRLHRTGGRGAEEFTRARWRHDKVVRSTHGVNCTGSCSWKVYVKDGIITWETQQTDYPSVGPDSPEYEPRGCPR